MGGEPVERNINATKVVIRPFSERDMNDIHRLNEAEGWTSLAGRKEDVEAAWENSNAAVLAVIDGKIAGFLRGMTDRNITLYVCEMLVGRDFRGMGIGTALLDHIHRLYPSTRMEMLATSSSEAFYQKIGFRPFYGFRRTIDEI